MHSSRAWASGAWETLCFVGFEATVLTPIKQSGNAEQDAALHGKERNDDFGHEAGIAVRGLLKNNNFAGNALQTLFGVFWALVSLLAWGWDR